MKADIALFFMILAAIAITGQVVRNWRGSSAVIGTTFSGLASVIGTATTGNPQFYTSTSHQ
jgi:hypothetical protein